ncbi:hypothetical protein HZA98_02780 [Candidatus Woesearchaeota archaeon]|nr:hypothetical protein [Candidatus Woesearchaeota archaeon]
MDALLLNNIARIFFEKFQEGDVKRHFADMSKVKKLLALEAKISLEEGLRKILVTDMT